MSWQDRDYAQGPKYRRPVMPSFNLGRSVVTTLIVVNVGVFLLISMGSGGVRHSGLFQWGALYSPLVLSGEVWRLITADYLHWNFGHIFMNMLALHFLGRWLERDWGGKRFFVIYTLSGVIGSVFYVLLTTVGWLNPDGVAVGASGCILGLLGACAVRYPNAQVYIYFLFPIKIRTAAILFAGWYTFNVLNSGDNAGGDACHLAGLGFGAWWALRGDAWWSRKSFAVPKFGGGQAPKVQAKPTFRKRVKQRREDELTIDRILRKVYEGGIHSLSESEKRALHEASERKQAREAGAERVDRL